MDHYSNLNPKIQSLDTQAVAAKWIRLGISVVPAQPKSKQVLIHWKDYQERLPSLGELNRWFGNGVMNLALVCGSGGLLVVDFDDLQDYVSFQEIAGELLYTYSELSGRGIHLFYLVEEGRPSSGCVGGVEMLGAGHLVIAAPSIHPTGYIYTPVDPDAQLLRIKTEQLTSLLSRIPTGPGGDLVGNVPAIGGTCAGITPKPGRPGARDGVVSRIKASIPILDYAGRLTTLLSSDNHQGRWWIGRCPFHDDKKPSFWVDALRGTWGCYSHDCSAHRGGDVINLVALVNGVDMRTAILQLKEMVK